MKKTYRIYLLFIFLFVHGIFCYGQISHKLNFKQKDIKITTIIARDSNEYKQIQIGNLQQTDEIGKPCLPVKFIDLIIPTGKDVNKIALNFFKKESILLDKKIIPAQVAIPTSLNYEELDFIKPDSLIYYSGNPYPIQIVKVVHQGYFDGNKRIVTIAVCPFQYYPKQDSLIFYSSVNFTLSFKNSKDKCIAVKFRTKNNTLMYNKILKSIVDNPQDISKCFDKSLEPIIKTQYSYPYFEYIIITNDDLAPAFNEFISWKRRKGINAGVVTLDYIYSHYNGDIISGIYDSAGQIRQFLHDAYINGTKYVLMAGDSSVVPIRYGWGKDDNDGDKNVIPTDLYFSTLNDNWDVDNDDRYGEPEDDIDDEPELFVGRLLCSNTEEIANWTQKLLKYEQNPGNGNYSYLTKAFFTQADDMQQENQAGKVSNHLTSFNTEIWGEEPSYNTSTTPYFPTGAQVINEMNKHYGLISLMTHGGATNVAVATKGYNAPDPNSKYKVTSFDDGYGGCCWIAETGNGFDNLTNTDYPSIYYSISCETMPFDDFGTPPGEKNMAEVYTTISKGGGPAYIGNTRQGKIDASYKLFMRFADLISNDTVNLGIAEGISKKGFHSWYSDQAHYIKLSHNLIGCPETEIWTAIPSLFTNVSIREIPNFNPHPIRTTAGNYSVTVYTGVPGSNICVMSVLDNGMSYYKVAHNVSSYSFSNVVKPYYVTITKHNYIPYLKNPENIYIQNKTITDNLNISAKNIYVGSNVTTSEPTGPVIIKNGAKVIFDAEQEVNLEQGFEIELGGEFEIKK